MKTPIKFFDDYNFSKVLKKKIFLIDLPGCDTTENKFNNHYNQTERTVYEKLLAISSSFVFINRGRPIGSEENRKILKQAYNIISDNSSLRQNSLVDNSLYIINMFEKLNEEDKEISQIQKDFSKIIFNDKESQEKNSGTINTELFNAKAYIDYLNEITEINNYKNLLNKFKKDFIQKQKKNFTKYCLTSIKTKLRESYININIKEINECDKSFFEDIKNEIMLIMDDLKLQYNESEDIENIKKLSNIIQYMNINITKNKLYTNSNCNNFFNILKNQIYKANNFTKNNFNNNLKDCFKFFDLIFDKDISPDKSKKNEEFQEKTKAILKNLEELESKYEIEKIFDKYLEQINDTFEYIIENRNELIEKYNKDIKNLMKEELENKIKKVLNDLNDEIEKSLKTLDDELSEYKNDLLTLFNMGLKNELKKGKYKAEIDLIIKFSFLDKLKLNISNLIGKDNTFAKVGIGITTSVIGYGLLSLLIPGVNLVEIIGGIILGLLSSFSIFLISKFIKKEKILLKKINSSRDEIQLNYLRNKTKFCRLYKNTILETKILFKDLLTVACSDLSEIEIEKWNTLKTNYEEVKTNIIKTEELK